MTDLLIQLAQFAKDFEEGIDFKFYNKISNNSSLVNQY